MTKVMLIQPPFTQPIESKKRCLLPLGIAYIGGYLRKHGIEVELLDCVVEGYNSDCIENGKNTFGLDGFNIKIKIEKFNPDFVGVSCLMTAQEHNMIDVCKIAKNVNPKIHTIVGGCHPSVFPEKCIKNKYIDSVVIGEGEHSTLEIVQGKKKGIVKNKPIDINKIPWPARDLLPMEKYIKINMPENIFSPNKKVTQVLTSRGCPFSCIFCATTNFHGQWRGRNPYDVFQEVKMLKEKYGIEEINFVDENLVLNRCRTKELMVMLGDLDIKWSNPGGIWIDGLDNYILDLMKKAGCYQLTFPVESFNKHILKKVIHKPLKVERVKGLVKHCHKLGIDVHAFFVCGFPEQTKEMLENDFNKAREAKFDSASFHIITPLPGSKIYEQYKDKINLDNINYIKATIPHPQISSVELETLINTFNINFNKSYKWRHPYKFFKKYVLIPYRKKFTEPFRRV